MNSSQGYFPYGELSIHYLLQGSPSGSQAVLIHGLGSSSRMWNTTVEHLTSRGFRCLTLDLPGHGDSSKPGHHWYSMDRFVDVVASLCRWVGLDRPVLFGHSMGGTIALKAAALQALPVRNLIVINPVVTGRLARNRTRVDPTLADRLVGVTRRLWPVASSLMRNPPISELWRPPRYVLRNWEDLGRTTADSALGSFRAVLEEDLTDQLSQVEAPVLVLVGTRDSTVLPEDGRRIPGNARAARLVELSAGHHPHDESPAAYFEAISSHLFQGGHVEA